MKFLLFTILCFKVFAAEYTLKDLEILYQNKEYKEFFQHARAIKPSDRNEYWKEMVQNSALQLVEQYGKDQTYSLNKVSELVDMFEWPILNTDDFFKIKVYTLVPKLLSLCLKEKKPLSCYQDLTPLTKNSENYPDLQVALYEILKPLSHTDQELALKFDFNQLLLPSLKHELSEFYCKKPIIQDFVLETAKLKNLVDDKELNSFVRYLHPDCLRSMENLTVTNLKSLDPATSEISLKLALMINHTKYEHLLFVYLLKHPKKSEWLNYSWNYLEKLKNKPFEREELIKDLKEYSVLPDQIFKSKDDPLNEVIIKKIAVNFPEYLDFYSQTCINYLDGNLKSEHGSPTPNCFDLKERAKKQGFLPSGIIRRIDRLQKFE
jgi:hypothetical protein